MLSIDLHGLRVKDAVKTVRDIMLLAIEQGQSEVYFVTGRGSHVNADGTSGVIKKILPSLLKPFDDLIAKVDKEPAAYKVKLKKSPTEKEKYMKIAADIGFFKVTHDFLKADANKGNAEAKYAWAVFCFSEPYEGDIAEALTTLRELEKEAMPSAAVFLAKLLLVGNKIDRNPKEAKRLLEKYAGHSPDAKFNLAKMLLQGEGIKQQEVRGKDLMLELAAIKYAPACCAVGQSYLVGDFTERDYSLAIEHLQEAANQDFSHAFTDLARCYAAGEGVPRDDKIALEYYRKAAKINNLFAIQMIGNYYATGRGGLGVNSAEAFKYYLRAAELGDADSQGLVGMHYYLGMGVQENKRQGLRWLKMAAEATNTEACYLLGCMLAEGRLVKKDLEKAQKYLRMAVKGQHYGAYVVLAIVILLAKPMNQVTQTEAYKLLKQAAETDNILDPCSGTKKLGGHYLAAATLFVDGANAICKEKKSTDRFAAGLCLLANFYTEILGNNTVGDNQIDLGLKFAEYAADTLDHTESQWFLVNSLLLNMNNEIPRIPERGLVYLRRLVGKEDPQALFLMGKIWLSGMFEEPQNSVGGESMILVAAQKGSQEAQQFLAGPTSTNSRGPGKP
jgi:TPR repeat protein